MYVVAVVGSREFPSKALVQSTVQRLLGSLQESGPGRLGIGVVSGGARGPDTWGTDAARGLEIPVSVIEPEWHLYGAGAGFRRNQRIADCANRCLAFWDGMSRGTLDTINRCFLRGIPVEVVRPDGKMFTLKSGQDPHALFT